MAASNIGTGLGIALGGRAKDFTQIELAQRRQAAMEEKAKAAAKDKKLEDITKDISIKPGEYFQFREKEVERMLGEYIEGQMSGSMDYGEAQKARWNLLTNLEKYKQEKKRADEFRKQALKGEAATDDDINILYTASTPEEVASSIKRGGIITAPDGAYTINGYKVINIPKRQMEIARNVKTEYDIANSQTTPDGKRVYIGEPKLEDYKAMLGADFDQDPDVVRNVISRHRDEFEQRGLEGDALIAAAREKYINIGSNFLSGRAFKSMGGDTNVNVNVGLGGDQTDYQLTPTPFRMNVIHRDLAQKGKETLEEVYVRNFVSTGEEAATIPLSAKAYDASTGEPIDKADFNKGVYNGFGVGYMLTKPMMIEENGVKKYFRPNQLVPERYEDEAIRRGAAQPKKLVFVKIGDTSVITEAEPYFMTTINSKDKTLRAIANKQLNLVNDTYNKEMSELDGRRKMLRGGKENPKPPTKESGGMPSTNQKPVSSQGGGGEKRFTSPSGEKAKSSLPKVNK